MVNNFNRVLIRECSIELQYCCDAIDLNKIRKKSWQHEFAVHIGLAMKIVHGQHLEMCAACLPTWQNQIATSQVASLGMCGPAGTSDIVYAVAGKFLFAECVDTPAQGVNAVIMETVGAKTDIARFEFIRKCGHLTGQVCQFFREV